MPCAICRFKAAGVACQHCFADDGPPYGAIFRFVAVAVRRIARAAAQPRTTPPCAIAVVHACASVFVCSSCAALDAYSTGLPELAHNHHSERHHEIPMQASLFQVNRMNAFRNRRADEQLLGTAQREGQARGKLKREGRWCGQISPQQHADLHSLRGLVECPRRRGGWGLGGGRGGGGLGGSGQGNQTLTSKQNCTAFIGLWNASMKLPSAS